MRLTDREQERLLIFSAAELARRQRDAGLKLSAPEAIALMCDAMHFAARRGATYAEVEAAIRSVHTYQVPEILAVPVMAGHAPYLDWMRTQLKGGGRP